MKYLRFILICCSFTHIYTQNNNNNDFTLNDTTSTEYKLGLALINKDTQKTNELLNQANINANYCMNVSSINTPFKNGNAPLLALALFYYTGDITIINNLLDKGADCTTTVKPVNCDDAITIAAFSWHCQMYQKTSNTPVLPQDFVLNLMNKIPSLHNAPY